MMTKNPQNEMNNFKNSVAMTVTLISFGMMFASLFLGFFLVRFSAPVWPPVEIENLPKLIPFFSTIVMALSSFTYWKMEKGIEKRKTFWLLTVTLGILFLVSQWSLWTTLAASGILVSNGAVPSMVYAFTWIHAGHIVIALGLLFWVGHLVFRRPEKVTEAKLINVGKFWHFLGVIWLIMYLMLFVL
jgi:cytochrome c oxidase subunit III